MKMRIQVVVETDDGTMAVQEVAKIAREDLRPDTVGLRLDEAKDLLRSVQQVVVERQITDHLTRQDSCPCCDRPRLHKGAHTVVLRTLFGTLRCAAPASTTARASRIPRAPSVRWPTSFRSAPRPSWCILRRSSPRWCPTA